MDVNREPTRVPHRVGQNRHGRGGFGAERVGFGEGNVTVVLDDPCLNPSAGVATGILECALPQRLDGCSVVLG